MAEALGAVLALPALGWLILFGFGAGAVYGFAGFGAALVFLPLATLLVPPAVAVAAFSLTALGSAVTLLPDAWRWADRRAALTVLVVALAFTPLGIEVLVRADPLALRWGMSLAVLGTLAALMAGWRMRTVPGWRSWGAVGAGVGVMGGATGLHGPILVLFQLAGQDSVAVTRATTIVVLTLSSLSMLPFMALRGGLPPGTLTLAMGLGLVLVPAYAVGGLAGRRLFDPARATVYRGTAYGLIGAAGLMGLPVWQG